MPNPRRGEIWLLRFPFTDLSSAKVRPALVLASHGDDRIVTGIFSRVPKGKLRRTWVRINTTHAAFATTGLKKTSVVKAEKIAVVHGSVFRRKLGTLTGDLMDDVQAALKRALHIPD